MIVTFVMKGAMLECAVASKDKRKQSSGSESEESDGLAAALEKENARSNWIRLKQRDRTKKRRLDV